MESMISDYPFLAEILKLHALKWSDIKRCTDAILKEQVLQSQASWAASVTAGGADYDEFSRWWTYAVKGAKVVELERGTVREALAQLDLKADHLVRFQRDTWERDTWPEISPRRYEHIITVHIVLR